MTTEPAMHPAAPRPADDTAAQVVRLRQGLWDVYRLLGGDTDGDATPAAIKSDLVTHVLDAARDHIATAAEAEAEAWQEGVDTALAHAVREDDGVRLRLDKPNPHKPFADSIDKARRG